MQQNILFRSGMKKESVLNISLYFLEQLAQPEMSGWIQASM